MIRQSLFKPEPPVVTQVVSAPISVVQLKETISLGAGDKFYSKNELDVNKRSSAFLFAQNFAFGKGLDRPKWVIRRQGASSTFGFLDLYLTQGLKSNSDTCFYAKDGNGTLLCFNLKAFKVAEYLGAFNSQAPQTYSVLDPFSIAVIPHETVKEQFGSHISYLEFMSLKGHEVC